MLWNINVRKKRQLQTTVVIFKDYFDGWILHDSLSLTRQLV